MGTEWLVLAGVYAVAGFFHGLVGFAFAVLAVPTLSLLYKPAYAVGTTVVIGAALMAYSTWIHRRRISVRTILPFLVSGLLAVPLGALFLRSLPEPTVLRILGVVVILMTLVAWSEKGVVFNIARRPSVGIVLSFLTGLVAGAFLSGGPLLVAFLYAYFSERADAKAHSQLFFAANAVAALISHSLTGTVTGMRVFMGLSLIPVAFAAITAGTYVATKISTRRFRHLTNTSLILLGLYLVISQS